MTEQSNYTDWIDRYVRDELSEKEVEVFEQRLMTDTELQEQLEAVLLMTEALKLENKDELIIDITAKSPPARNQWSSMAIAASVLLAVVSTTLYWKTSVEAGRLQEQLNLLQAPRTSVLNVPVSIMRSSGNSTPDIIVQKPGGQAVIVLKIELSSQFSALHTIQFQLNTDEGVEVLNWTGAPDVSGNAVAVLNPESVPNGLLRLQISDPNSDLVDSRLLEFR